MSQIRSLINASPDILTVDGIPLVLLSGEELACAMGYPGLTSAFRAWCRRLGIKPVPGRTNTYDPKLVRARLDAAQGIEASPHPQEVSPTPGLTLVEQRRKRREENRH